MDGWGTGVQYPEIAGNYDRVVSRVLWGSYGGCVGSSLATGNHRYGPVYNYIGMSHQMVRPCQPAGHRRPGGVAVALNITLTHWCVYSERAVTVP
jgi:hypothetical protein